MNESEINKDAKGKGERGGGGQGDKKYEGKRKGEGGGEKGRECLQPCYCFLHLYVRRRT